MKLQLSSKDWQLLSAYLDGQLSTRERTQVEQRLRTQPEYRDALQSLRQNQAMLRSLPRHPVPRNFTLTPDMVAAPRRMFIPPLAPVLRFSSALATLFLILTFALQQLPRLSPAMQSAPDALPEMTVMEAPAAEPEMYSLEGEEADGPPVVYWGGPPSIPYANGLGGVVEGRGGGGGDGGMIIEQLPNVFNPPVPIYPDAPKGGAGMEEAEPQEVEPQEAEPPAGEEERTAIAEVPEMEGTGPILGVPSEDEAGRLLEPLADPVRDLAVENYGIEQESQDSLLVVQIGLGLLALITGAAAFILRKRAAS